MVQEKAVFLSFSGFILSQLRRASSPKQTTFRVLLTECFSWQKGRILGFEWPQRLYGETSGLRLRVLLER